MTVNKNQELRNGARVAVVGGGPAGSFFSFLLLKRARAIGLRLDVTIFDPKKFLKHGLPGCNMCAGALGERLVRKMEGEGLRLPDGVVRHRVRGYTIHSQRDWARIFRGSGGEICTVYRGQGPLRGGGPHESFDQFLLDRARDEGAAHETEEVEAIIPGSGEVRLRTTGGGERAFDLAVGAFGVNSDLGGKLTFGYRPPKTWQVCQAEMEVGREAVRKRFEDMIHIFTLGGRNVKFVAFTPKEDFVTVSAIGRHVTIDDLTACLKDPRIAPFLEPGWTIHCHCHPLLPVTPARRPCADRFLAVGDAFVSRYLKSGIESAFRTASLAARCVPEKGISKRSLSRHYAAPCRRFFSFDNLCGKVLFAVNDIIASRPLLSGAHLTHARREQFSEFAENRLLSDILWHTFTGDASYRRILGKALNPVLIARLTALTARDAFRGLASRPAEGGPPLFLPEGGTVAIVGGGPAGCSCAIRLLQRAADSGKNIRVLLYEGKTYERHYNQCIGVLSPPLEEFLGKYLRMALPASLIKRRITGYCLHSGDGEVLLDCPEGSPHTYAVRRLEFDNLFLQRAIGAGARYLNCRVMGLEFVNTGSTDEVRIYSESGFERADVAVIACGLDEAILSRLESPGGAGLSYRRPHRVLKSYITRLDAPADFIEERIGSTIHAFLPPELPRVEFGAVTPKDDHITVNIAGREVTSEDLDRFLDLPGVRRLLPPVRRERLNYYEGRFPISPASRPFGRRCVVTGDATGWMRSFKGKGINTAVITGIVAADTILEGGVDSRAFRRYEEGCRDLRRDSFYGALVRNLCNFAVNRSLFREVIDLAPGDEALRRYLYGAVSGEESFRNIVRGLMRSGFFFRVAGRFFARRIRRGKRRRSRNEPAEGGR